MSPNMEGPVLWHTGPRSAVGCNGKEGEHGRRARMGKREGKNLNRSIKKNNLGLRSLFQVRD